MRVSFYNSSADPKKVTKSGDLQLIRENVEVSLLASTSILHPNLSVALDPSYFANINYARIDAFGRWYFVKPAVILDSGIVQVQLDVDALSSWGAQLRSSRAMVTRQQYVYDMDIVDSRIPVLAGQDVTYKHFGTPLNVYNGDICVTIIGGEQS